MQSTDGMKYESGEENGWTLNWNSGRVEKLITKMPQFVAQMRQSLVSRTDSARISANPKENLVNA